MVRRVLKWRDMQRIIDHMPEDVKAAIKNDMIENANRTVAIMKRIAPSRTGKLRGSIKWRWGREKVGINRVNNYESGQLGAEFSLVIVAGGDATTKKNIRKSSKGNSPPYDYAKAIESGVKNPKYYGHRLKSGPRKGTRFFYGTWRLAKKSIQRSITTQSRNAIKRSVQK